MPLWGWIIIGVLAFNALIIYMGWIHHRGRYWK
jgi:hypothetical protein